MFDRRVEYVQDSVALTVTAGAHESDPQVRKVVDCDDVCDAVHDSAVGVVFSPAVQTQFRQVE